MYAQLDSLVGTPPLSVAIGQVNANPPLTPPGIFTQAVDPYWGAGEFIYARANGVIPAMSLVTFLPSFQTNIWRFDAIVAANTTLQGRMAGVALQVMASGDYGWFAISGLVPVASNASVAADTITGVAAAGQLGANTAGKALLNARVVAAATTTVIKTGATGLVGGVQIAVSNTDGWFPGVYLSGTGIPAATIVLTVDPSGRFVTINNALTSAWVGGSITGTYNNATIFYNVVHLNRSFLQGPIT